MLDFEALVICCSDLFFYFIGIATTDFGIVWLCLAFGYLLDLSWHSVLRQPSVKAAPLHRLEGSV